MHEASLRRHVTTPKPPPDRPSFPATYVICTTPRSGSWLLSEGLAGTSLAGNPREWLNTLQEQQYRARWRMEHATDLSLAHYLALAHADSTTNNGISGIKLHYYQFADLPRLLASYPNLSSLSPAEVVGELFPSAKYIWLTRREKDRQAVSYHLASMTAQWWLIESSQPVRNHSQGLTFDPESIQRKEAILTQHDQNWCAFFREKNITPLSIYYEDLAADYRATLEHILRWLDIPHPSDIAIGAPRLQRQSNAINEEWLSNYRSYKDGKPHDGQPSRGELDESSSHGAFDSSRDAIMRPWRQWIGQHEIRGGSEAEVVAVLENNGFSKGVALAEASRAKSDPYLRGATITRKRLDKAVSLLTALSRLRSLDSGSVTVERRATISRDEFRDRYYAANRPLILYGLMSTWRAMTAWTPDYLKRAVGDQLVEVMTDRNADPKYEIDSRRRRTMLPFSDYVDKVYSGVVTNDYYLVANNAFLESAAARPLLGDFSAFPEYLTPTVDGRCCFLWFGPAGTVTPLHHDTSNILIAQVAGRKRFRLVPATQWPCLYNRTGVFSEVDCERPDLTRHPRFGDADVIDIVLSPGEVLFLPVGWWHHVRALDVSMTVSFTNFVFPNHFVWD